MHLATSELFNARWSDQIHDEWIRNLMERRPDLTQEQLQKIRMLMDKSVPDCLVKGHESLAEKLDLPDPDDNHVLAAAIIARADVIVTYNLKDFPSRILDIYEIEAQHPDDFVCCQIDLHPGLVYKSMKRHRESLKNPAETIDEYLAALRAQQMTQTVARLEEFKGLL